MKLEKVNSGKLRAIGYDTSKRQLHITLENGVTLIYNAISDDLWRRFRSASSPWSFYRDYIEDEFSCQRVTVNNRPAGYNPLDELFKKD